MFLRRAFLFCAAALLFLAIQVPALWAESSGVDLGFSLYGMKALPLMDAVRVCGEHGFRNVELALNAGFPTEPKVFPKADRTELRRVLEERKMRVSGFMLSLSLVVDDATHARNLELLREAIELGHDLHPEETPLIETVLGGKPAEWAGLREKMAERLTDWARVAEEGRVILAIKAHVGSAVNQPDRLLWLLERVPNPAIQIAYDFSHFQLQGLSLEETLKPLIARTRFIHIKDADGDPKKFRFLLPGEGKTDYAAYFRLLKELGYRGPVVVEVSGMVFNQPGYDPEAAVRKCQVALTPAMK